MPMPDSNSSSNPLHQSSSPSPPSTALHFPAKDQTSSFKHLCGRGLGLLNIREIIDQCPHQTIDERRAALLCLQACDMATASSVLGLPASTGQCKRQLDSLHYNFIWYECHVVYGTSAEQSTQCIQTHKHVYVRMYALT